MVDVIAPVGRLGDGFADAFDGRVRDGFAGAVVLEFVAALAERGRRRTGAFRCITW
jgi:hypothetical protein